MRHAVGARNAGNPARRPHGIWHWAHQETAMGVLAHRRLRAASAVPMLLPPLSFPGDDPPRWADQTRANASTVSVRQLAGNESAHAGARSFDPRSRTAFARANWGCAAHRTFFPRLV